MSEEPLSLYRYDSFKSDLEEIYGCPYIGQGCPAPYALPDEGPDLFHGPVGIFSVPRPTGANGFYHQWIIIRILETNQLKVLPSSVLSKAAENVEILRITGNSR